MKPKKMKEKNFGEEDWSRFSDQDDGPDGDDWEFERINDNGYKEWWGVKMVVKKKKSPEPKGKESKEKKGKK